MEKKNGLKGRQVQQYIRLSYLVPDLQNLIDDGKIGMTTGVELSYLTAAEQMNLYDEILLNDGKHYPSKEQAKQMRKLSKDGKLDIDAIVEILDREKPNQMEHFRVSFRVEEIQERIPDQLKSKNWGQKDFEAFIHDAMDYYIKYPEHGQGKHYGEWKAQQDGRPTDRGDIRRDLESVLQYMAAKPTENLAQKKPNIRRDIRQDFDDASLQASTMKELVEQMEARGYIWNFSGKYPKIKPPGKDRYFRLYKLGEGYDSLETLARRVLEMQQKPQTKQLPRTRYRYHGSFKKRKKATGFLALYYYHCYRIGVFQKRKYPKYTPEYRAAQKQLHEMTKVTVFLRSAGIRSMEDLKQYQGKITQGLKECDAAISDMNQKLVQSNTPEENQALVHQLDTIRERQKTLLQQKKLCKLVEEQQPQEQEKTDSMQLK